MFANISAQEAYELAQAGDLNIIDVRRPDEWAATGMPEFGHGITMGDPKFLEKLAALNITHTTPLAIICAAGVRSANVQQFLLSNGFENVSNIAEGMMGGANGDGWLRQNLPLQSYHID